MAGVGGLAVHGLPALRAGAWDVGRRTFGRVLRRALGQPSLRAARRAGLRQPVDAFSLRDGARSSGPTIDVAAISRGCASPPRPCRRRREGGRRRRSAASPSVDRVAHVPEPRVALGRPDPERHVAHPQPRMAALVVVRSRAAPVLGEEQRQPAACARRDPRAGRAAAAPGRPRRRRRSGRSSRSKNGIPPAAS